MEHCGGAGCTTPEGRFGSPVDAGAHSAGISIFAICALTEAVKHTIANNIRDIRTLSFRPSETESELIRVVLYRVIEKIPVCKGLRKDPLIPDQTIQSDAYAFGCWINGGRNSRKIAKPSVKFANSLAGERLDGAGA
jgi:hypothetical protein